jgi:hypothetical protein
VHVSRRWRSIVFGSPRHLNLQLVCGGRTPVRDMLDVWPSLPLIIATYGIGSMDNIVAALQCTDRVCQISLIDVSLDSDIFGAMQRPFPELTHLQLSSEDETVPGVPDSFLGGSAPRLEFLHLEGIPFPGLPKLLLSATHLVTLRIQNIPHSGCISPNRMVAALSTLTNLDSLSLQFESPRSCPDQANRLPPPSTRFIVPVLTSFRFKGVSEYLEDLVACIYTPQLHDLSITFSNDIVFDTLQLVQFINRTPRSNALEEAHIFLQSGEANVIFLSKTFGYRLEVEILCEGLDWQVSSLEQVCTSCLPLLSVLETLYIDLSHSQIDWQDSFENGLWLELLRPFTAVKNLYLSKDVASHIANAVQELCVEGRTTQILPTLQNIFLRRPESSGPVQEDIGQFVDARKVAGCSIAVSPWTNPIASSVNAEFQSMSSQP